ncbi:hypothetical protein H4R35_005510 [Dimargaris xerosporica]|nr:hypothetical protein H4R35_005510 [Dimargaris xerosporica]
MSSRSSSPVSRASSRESDTSTRTITQYMFKILVVGDAGAGKTSIIKRYVEDDFANNYKTTIGVDFAIKPMAWDEDTIVRLQLWDIAGQERYSSLTRVYYKEAIGALVVYDVTNPGSFEAVQKWKQDLDAKVILPDTMGGGPIPAVLLANKCDLASHSNYAPPQSLDALDTLCQDYHFAAWFPTSAKENSNLDEAIRHLVSAILHMVQTAEEETGVNPLDGSTRDAADGRRINLESSGTKSYLRCCF